MTLDDMRKTLNKKGLDIGPIEKVDVADISPSGRAVKIRIFHGGRETSLSGNDFRLSVPRKANTGKPDNLARVRVNHQPGTEPCV